MAISAQPSQRQVLLQNCPLAWRRLHWTCIAFWDDTQPLFLSFFSFTSSLPPSLPLARTPSQQVPLEAPASTVPRDMVGPGNSCPAHTWRLPSCPGVVSRSRIPGARQASCREEPPPREEQPPGALGTELHVLPFAPCLCVSQWDQHLHISRWGQHRGQFQDERLRAPEVACSGLCPAERAALAPITRSPVGKMTLEADTGGVLGAYAAGQRP